MKKSLLGVLLVAMLGSSGVWANDNLKTTVSTIADQSGVAVTIYNSNLGLVKDIRKLNLPGGSSELRFMDVATSIIPASVHIRSLNDGESLQVLEQNYEYDLLSPQKLMDKYVGREVKLYEKNPFTEREEQVTATLLSNNNGPIFKIGNDITFGHPGRVIFPGVPDSLIASPTLVWLLDNRHEGQKVEATYLTSGISWRADYVLTLNERDDRCDLGGWVTITNNSGATYRNASLKLVAGDVNRVREEVVYDRAYKYGAMPAAMPAPAPQFKEEGLFEYHIYTLQRPSTIKENQSKQISLLSASEIPVRKEFLLSGANYYYKASYGEIATKQKVGVYIELENREKNHLGMPLPKGIVRVYKQDNQKALQFVGEDNLDHTPKDERVRIKMGEAFDVVADKKQTDWKKTASDSYEAAYDIVIRNHKKEAILVKVSEPVPGDWKLLKASHPSSKANSGTLEFTLDVPADGETKLSYRVAMRY